MSVIFDKINFMKSIYIIWILSINRCSFGHRVHLFPNKSVSMKKKFTIAIHGGAG
jgi:hypothetical protein